MFVLVHGSLVRMTMHERFGRPFGVMAMAVFVAMLEAEVQRQRKNLRHRSHEGREHG